VDGEDPSVCTVKIKTARIGHQCVECRSAILRGQKYEHVKGCWEGKWLEIATCLPCSELRDEVKADSHDREYPPFGDLGEWAREAGFDFPARMDVTT
jgi:hypothetical protein